MNVGSPPQVRGKRRFSVSVNGFNRITPAGAGKTNPVFNVDFAYRDHPRRCGENLPVARGGYYGLGSPPQVRGKPAHGSLSGWFRRITPAGAGKTNGLI